MIDFIYGYLLYHRYKVSIKFFILDMSMYICTRSLGKAYE